MLEQDFLCESLKGRVAYFATRYRTAHDHTGRVCILVDKKEILNIPYETQYEIYHRIYDAEQNGAQRGQKLYNEIKEDLAQEGHFVAWDFGYACDEYFDNPIEKSLQSENMLIRMFAVMDRRVGKRTLEYLRAEFDNLPEWLKFFFDLRLNSEFYHKSLKDMI